MIKNASSIPLSANSGTLPNMQGAMLNWFQPMVATTIVKTVVAYKVVETLTNTNFQGVIQPFTPQMLEMKPEGQRSWIWKTLHCFPDLTLVPDEKATIQGVEYRIMQRLNYTEYGYLEYHLVEDYQ